MLSFAFISDAATKEYKSLPEDIQDLFGKNLRYIQHGENPPISIKHLQNGVIELRENGSPAYRCVYIAKYLNSVIILHSFEKTAQGTDRQAMKTIEERYKLLMSEVKE